MEKINFVNNSEPYLSAENLNQMQDNIEDAINEVNDKVTLWINNNPSASFQAQTLNLDLSSYSIIEIVYYRYPSATTPLWRGYYKTGETTILNYCDFDSGTLRAWSRQVQFTDSSVVFASNYINNYIDNSGMVPYKIIGHK